ncbi:MAG: hypothetical protein HUU55_04660 [Myxococcales bacterium]|nr:hypothetical protein [Myxococcales bacterium]
MSGNGTPDNLSDCGETLEFEGNKRETKASTARVAIDPDGVEKSGDGFGRGDLAPGRSRKG